MSPTVSELETLLDALIDVEQKLGALLDVKLAAMRRADIEGMIATTQGEAALTAELSRLDAKRIEVVAALCRELGIPVKATVRRLSLRAISQKLAPAVRTRVLKKAETLREKMLSVAQANKVVDLVSREILAHFKGLFSAMVQDELDLQTYGAAGQVSAAKSARVLDALG